MTIAASFSIPPSREPRSELPTALARFRIEGLAAQPVVFGAHSKPETVVISFALYASLLPFLSI
ncbi:hypothetical protein [Cryobacterium sp. Y11]|jgi:hypothetical protein|uniref:hypothetical protein n=1 Tax=Cryobacterium sp. Y11 TaxID=2045016 RepID=UPI000CE45E2C|nr:hypothetical protein [Cryobacterium sp. Y11]